jgi:hypothetical protein
MKKRLSQTTSTARKLKCKLNEKKRRRTGPRKFTLPSPTCSNVPQPLIKMKRADKIALVYLYFINSDNVGLAQYELIHQFKEGGFPNACHLCIRSNPSTIPWRIPLPRLKHTKQLHCLCIQQTRIKFCQTADRLPHLPFGPRTRLEEVS